MSKNVGCFFEAEPPFLAAFFADRKRANICAWFSFGYAARNFRKARQVSELGLFCFIAAREAWKLPMPNMRGVVAVAKRG